MRVSLAMIVRNESANLPDCLDSVRGLFAELVIVDTGSTDDTVKIARKFGARIFKFPWCDRFDLARNYGLDRCQGDYVFRMDADDRLPGHQWKRMQRLFDRLRPDHPACWLMRVYNNEAGDRIGCDEVRLWPNVPNLRFRGWMHDRILPQQDAPSLSVFRADVHLEHVGYSDAVALKAKFARNLRILEKEINSPPVNPLTWFDYGRTLAAYERWPEAVEALERFLKERHFSSDIAARCAYRRLVGIHFSSGDNTLAVEVAARGLKEFPDDAHLVASVADALRLKGEMDLAMEGYRKALDLDKPERADSGISSLFRTRVETAMAECVNGS